MALYRAGIELTWDVALVESADASQRWILKAMQADGPALVTLLWRILGNETDVCDAYQDVFLRLANLSGGKKPRNIRAYLFRTASNVAISMLRRDKMFKQSLTRVQTSRRDDPPDPGAEIDARRMQQRLRAAVAQLPDYLGNVIVLRDLADMPYADVARTLGITPAAARVYRHKAIQLLAAWLGTDNAGDEFLKQGDV